MKRAMEMQKNTERKRDTGIRRTGAAPSGCGGRVKGLWLLLVLLFSPLASGLEGLVTGPTLTVVREWALGLTKRGVQGQLYQLYQMPQDGQWTPLTKEGSTTSILPLAPGRGILLVQQAQLMVLEASADTPRVLKGFPAQVNLKELLAWRVPESGPEAQPTLDTLIILATGRKGAAQVDTLLELKLESGQVAGVQPSKLSAELVNRDRFFATWTVYRCKKQDPVSQCLTAINHEISSDQRISGGQRSKVRLTNLKGSYDFLDAAWVPGSSTADLYLLARPVR